MLSTLSSLLTLLCLAELTSSHFTTCLFSFVNFQTHRIYAILFFFFPLHFNYLAGTCVHHGTHVEVGGQLAEVASLFLPHGFWV